MASRKGSKNGKYRGEKLLKYESMKNWIESLNYCAVSRGKKGLTKGARKQRLGRMADFVEYTGLNPDQLLEEAQNDINLAGKRIIDYFNDKVKEGLSRNTMVTRVGFIRGFYTHNNLFFPKKWRIPSRKKSKVAKSDEQNGLFKKNGNGEVVLKSGLLQQFIQNLNFRDQTIALCLLSTGADASDLLALNFSFVKDATGAISKEKRLLWHGNRAKDGVEFRVFLSQEATEFLKRYVKQSYIEQERNRNQGKEFVKVTDDTPLFFVTDFARGNYGNRLSVDSLASNFRESAKKMGYVKKGVTNPFRPKRFRHLFRNACSYAKIDQGWTLSMMGHASNVSHDYLEKPTLLLEEEYIKLEPFVTVFGTGKDQVDEMTTKIKKLESSVESNNSTFNKTAEVFTEKISQLETTVKTLKAELEKSNSTAKSWQNIFTKNYLPLLKFVNELSELPQFEELKKKAQETKLKKFEKEWQEQLADNK